MDDKDIGCGDLKCDKLTLVGSVQDSSKSALSGGLSNAMFLNGLLELWSHLKRATQLDIINRMREQPKAILTPMQLQILEANLKTE